MRSLERSSALIPLNNDLMQKISNSFSHFKMQFRSIKQNIISDVVPLSSARVLNCLTEEKLASIGDR